MSTNHAERLRSLARLTSASFLDDAADEIDRLTAEIARLQRLLADPDAVAWANAVKKNGGSISPERLAKISDFIKAEKAHKIWDLTDDYMIGSEVTLKKRALIKAGKRRKAPKRRPKEKS